MPRIISLLLLLYMAGFAKGQDRGGQPNIILIMTDQHRGDAVGYEEGSKVITPNLNKLAAEGVYFTNAYSSVPSCTPARAGLLTGLSPWHHGMLGYGRVARKYGYEMPGMLQELGYYTFGIGKMHWYPQKALHGFNGTLVDESGRIEQDGFVSDYRDWFKLQAPGLDPDATGIGWNEHNSATYKLDENLHPTYWTAQTAIDLIHNFKLMKPLFLKISFARPHSPYDPPKRFLEMYKDVEIDGPVVGEWAKKYAEWPEHPSAFYGNYGDDHAIESKRHYYANITFIDEQIGRVVEALKEAGMYDNSMICFTSDHGDMLGDHNHWRKTYAYEGSSRIPYLLKWPEWMEAEAEKGSEMLQAVELRDFLPTFIDAAGGTVPDDMDGASLLSLIKDKDTKWRRYIDLEHASIYDRDNYWCSLTDGRRKYIWFFFTGKEQLFDLDSDPQELVDLSVSSKHRKDLKLWRNRMIQHLSERGEEYVRGGELVIKKESRVYSPNYPADAME